MSPLTYLEFHAVFLVPPLLVLGLAGTRPRWRPYRCVLGGSEVRPVAVVIVVAIALAYTTPWDNYLIEVGVWSYGSGSVSGVLWRAPLEEYLFIVLQPVLAGLWLHLWTGDGPPTGRTVLPTARTATAGLVAATCVGLTGVLLLVSSPATLYLGAVLAWAAPVLALQWAVGWQYLLARWRTLLVGVVGPTCYLGVADRLALEAGVWTLAENYTTGVAILGLPVEEALFFLVTSLFVVQALLLYPWARRRWL